MNFLHYDAIAILNSNQEELRHSGAQSLGVAQQNALFIQKSFSDFEVNRVFTDCKDLDDPSLLAFMAGLSHLALRETQQKRAKHVFHILSQLVLAFEVNHSRPTRI